MRCELSRDYRFEAAHSLPCVPATHKCRRAHGHGYLIRVTVAGEVDPETGWVMDFATIDAEVSPVLKELDHQFLNDLPGLENPTSEVLAGWLWQRIRPRLALLSELMVAETPQSRCVYRGE